MSDTERATLGPAGKALKDNVRRIRLGRRMTYVELSQRLTSIGRPVAVLGLRRIERGERRVDVDDLLALAYALNVPPVDLLVPDDAVHAHSITSEVAAPAEAVREWIAGRSFLTPPSNDVEMVEAVRWVPQDRRMALLREWVAAN